MRGRTAAYCFHVPLTARFDPESSWGFNGSSDYLIYSRNPLSVLGSTETLHNSTLLPSDGLDNNLLLNLSDCVRADLGDKRSLGLRWEEAMGFLSAVLKDEICGVPRIDFSTIQKARLDKLLSDIINPRNRPSPTPTRFRDDVIMVEKLQRLWRTRFREQYFTVDQERYFNLPKTGRLRNVIMSSGTENNQCLWTTQLFGTLSEFEGNQFETGHWWLNLACAYRDSIVGSVIETSTKGKYGIAALPLMTGREDVNLSEGIVTYIREGKISDIHLSLISRVGSKIRILRGHKLQSPLAPKAGVRYDGLYKILQYGQKLDVNTELHQLALKLERVKNQLPVEEVIKIPRPSQLDDWELFEKYEGEMMNQRRGPQAWMDWKMEKAQEKIDREQYMRALAFHTSLELAKIGQLIPLVEPPAKGPGRYSRII
ncbi:PUA-like domain-containing protein [Mariannaea sp. PMI_226]|nr:PUA-like domain-containing protein [Mariannaea sp. PMI_226]